MLNAGAEGVLDGSWAINSKYDQNRLLLLLLFYMNNKIAIGRPIVAYLAQGTHPFLK